MARKRRKRKQPKLELKPTIMKLPIIEHIAASNRKINMLAGVMKAFNLKFLETDNGQGFKVVAQV